MTIAGRARLGTIFGASRDRIAPSRRFYAGGGGSVRGYGFQALGPRDPVFDDPIGGRSLAEFALEARVRVGEFGIVPFIDAGNISTSPLPRLRRSAVRRRHRRALPHPLRPDPGRCRNPAQSAQRRSADRGLRLARPGLLMAEKRSSIPRRRSGRACAVGWLAAAGRFGSPRRLVVPLLGLVLGFAALVAFLDTGAGPPLHRRPDRGDDARIGPAHPHRADRRLDLGPHPAARTSGSTIPTACSPNSPEIDDGLAADRFPLGSAW